LEPTVASYYWSATTFATLPLSAWFVDFYEGGVFNGGKGFNFYVRAVRTGS
jgi:hypothetical protein